MLMIMVMMVKIVVTVITTVIVMYQVVVRTMVMVIVVTMMIVIMVEFQDGGDDYSGSDDGTGNGTSGHHDDGESPIFQSILLVLVETDPSRVSFFFSLVRLPRVTHYRQSHHRPTALYYQTFQVVNPLVLAT